MMSKDVFHGQEAYLKARFESLTDNGKITRRNFLKISSAAVAGSTFSMCSPSGEKQSIKEKQIPDITRYRTLGRTNFRTSDIGMGGLPEDSNVVRYCYDRGINYFDTAESYGNGEAEKRIGDAMQFMERKKIFITTKLALGDTDTEETLLERYGKCLERLKTDYADALFMHAVQDVNTVTNTVFHGVVARLKADGRVRFGGISCHGPRGDEGDSLEKILVTAAEDGRFDLMLLSYSFMNKEEAEKVLAVCKERNIGTTAMKTMPGVIELDPFDPENPTGDYLEYIERAGKQGVSKEEAIERIQNWIVVQEATMAGVKPFAEKWGVTSNDELRKVSLQWVLRNPDMHTVCMSLNDYEGVDTFVPLSGTTLSEDGLVFLQDFEKAYGTRYCRHACNKCAGSCSKGVPVSTIMRYSYYYKCQGREKYAIQKYAALGDRNASLCESCSVPCDGACPYGVNIRANLFKAHSLLTLV